MARFEKRNLHLYFEDYFVHWPDDGYHQLKGTTICFRFL
jgi:hypothetical protein